MGASTVLNTATKRWVARLVVVTLAMAAGATATALIRPEPKKAGTCEAVSLLLDAKLRTSSPRMNMETGAITSTYQTFELAGGDKLECTTAPPD